MGKTAERICSVVCSTVSAMLAEELTNCTVTFLSSGGRYSVVEYNRSVTNTATMASTI